MGTRRSARTTFTALAAMALIAALAHPALGAEESPPVRDLPTAAQHVTARSGASPRLQGALLRARGQVSVFIELAAPNAADAYAASAPTSRSAAKGAALDARAQADRTASTVVAAVRSSDAGAQELFRTANAVAGVAVTADAASIRSIAARSDVVSIKQLVPKRLENAHAAQLTNVLKTWQDVGVLGTGVRVGIIDSGIDYTHANFGGPGTVKAFKSVNPTKPTPLFPTAKVVGGYDLAGENYDADSDDPAQLRPHPDSNPLDCDGHGSHVAGITAGFGENPNGTTFRGNYRDLTAKSLDAMRIGPGMAPKALLYAFKVFGCPEGEAASTGLVAPGIDRALDPNNDGDMSDHMDLVNISIGGDYGTADDPEGLFVRNAFRHGMLVVTSAGNGGDLYDVGGSPNATTESLSVASTRDSYELLDALQVTQPTSKAGLEPGQYSEAFDLTGYSKTAPVAHLTGANADGCDAIPGRYSGKFLWLEWDDNDATRRCGSATRTDNAAAAGAAGVILTSTLEHFNAGITGDALIPTFQLKLSATRALRPALNAGTLRVRLGADLVQRIDFVDPSIQDTPSGFTSRGNRSPSIKPDIGAPGDTIVSTGRGTGNRPAVLSGTSMASPHVAGIAALVRQAHPTWSTTDIKADLMNTANHDVYSLDGPKGPIEAPNRIGSGRVDARAALGNLVTAAADAPGSPVSVSFGPVEVSGDQLRLHKTVVVRNKGSVPVSYRLSYQPITQMPGVSYQLSASSLSVPAHGSARVDVTLTAVRDAMRKTADPTIEKIQLDVPRQFLADASGRIAFQPVSGTTWPLRVPVYAAPKPTSGIQVPHTVRVSGQNGSGFLRLGGRGLSQGSGDQAYDALGSIFELGAVSHQLPGCGPHDVSGCAINQTARGADLHYVGAGTNAPVVKAQGHPQDAVMYFGIATWNNWENVGVNTVPFVDFDVNHDGTPDFETYVFRATGTDVLIAETDDLATGDVVDQEPANTAFGDVDTNTFDTNVIVLPVFLEALGINPRASSARITYQVGTFSYYSAPADDGIVDAAHPVSYDPLNPGLWTSSGPLFFSEPGKGTTVHRNKAALAKDHSQGDLLVFNLHNRTEGRALLSKVVVAT
ncbi:MAG: S8 family serine peptidase [Acidimicrobiia bacterium]|nr:S8 family serine peptidase [Acidimicrobiia bacterium]